MQPYWDVRNNLAYPGEIETIAARGMDDNGKARIHVMLDGQTLGPLSLPAALGALRVGRFQSTQPARLEGEQRWRPLETIIEELNTAHPPSSPRKTVEGNHNADSPDSDRPPHHRIAIISISGVAFLIFCILLISSKDNQPDDEGSTKSPAPADEVPITETPESSEPLTDFELATSQREAARCAVMISTGSSRGSGSLVMKDGRAWLYTNIHVVCDEDFEITDFRGKPLEITEVGEVPSGHPADLVRFRLRETPKILLEMAITEEIEMGDEVAALGDSAGEGLITSLPGLVTGIGPDRVQVGCEFVPGNSGGPIVNQDGKLLALASYLTNNQTIWAKGTSQEVRRFGWITAKEYQWERISRRELAREAQLVERTATTARLLAAMLHFPMETNGFKIPKTWPAEDLYELGMILKESSAHPLFEGLVLTNKTLSRLSSSPSRSAQAEALREYNRFLGFCGQYYHDELSEVKNLKSAYWKKIVEARINDQQAIASQFQSNLDSFKRSGSLGKSLSEY